MKIKTEKIKVPTIIAVLLLIISTSLTVFLSKQRQLFKLGAQQAYPPQDVKTTNITDSSFTVIWSTHLPTTGFVQWGESKGKLDETSMSETGDKSYLHSSTVSGLQPSKTYYFKIVSGGNTYGNNEKAWEVKTAPKKNSDSPSGNFKIGGKVITASGSEAGGILIIAQIEGAIPLSTITSQNGNWIISLNAVVNNNLDHYLELSPDTRVHVIAQGGPQGISNAEFYLKSGESLPPMILGQNHDFTNLQDIKESTPPNSEIGAPIVTTKRTKFETTEIRGDVNTNEEISLDSIEDNEIVYTTRPEFFGKAPPLKEITIRLESESPLSATISAARDGMWRWSPPTRISPGNHRIIISYRDRSGVLKSIIRNFIVAASELNEPAFESTPSASLVSTPTPQPTATASAQRTASPLTTPAQPVSGGTTPTLILFSIALLLFTTGGLLFFVD